MHTHDFANNFVEFIELLDIGREAHVCVPQHVGSKLTQLSFRSWLFLPKYKASQTVSERSNILPLLLSVS